MISLSLFSKILICIHSHGGGGLPWLYHKSDLIDLLLDSSLDLINLFMFLDRFQE